MNTIEKYIELEDTFETLSLIKKSRLLNNKGVSDIQEKITITNKKMKTIKPLLTNKDWNFYSEKRKAK